MNLLFIADPVEHFKIYKDTTFAMMREAQRRGHALAVSEPRHMHWQRGGRVVAAGDPRVHEAALKILSRYC